MNPRVHGIFTNPLGHFGALTSSCDALLSLTLLIGHTAPINISPCVTNFFLSQNHQPVPVSPATTLDPPAFSTDSFSQPLSLMPVRRQGVTSAIATQHPPSPSHIGSVPAQAVNRSISTSISRPTMSTTPLWHPVCPLSEFPPLSNPSCSTIPQGPDCVHDKGAKMCASTIVNHLSHFLNNHLLHYPSRHQHPTTAQSISLHFLPFPCRHLCYPAPTSYV